MGPALLNTFVSDMDSGTEHTLSKSAESTRLCAVTDTLEGRDDFQRNPSTLKRWVRVNFMKFNTAKCKVLHLAWGNPKCKHRLGKEWIENSPEEKDCGMFADEKLNMTQPMLLQPRKPTTCWAAPKAV